MITAKDISFKDLAGTVGNMVVHTALTVARIEHIEIMVLDGRGAEPLADAALIANAATRAADIAIECSVGEQLIELMREEIAGFRTPDGGGKPRTPHLRLID